MGTTVETKPGPATPEPATAEAELNDKINLGPVRGGIN
jgi:hypothetical protein